MADSALITRRAAFVGALASTVALAVPAAAAVQYVKIGSPSFSVRPEVKATEALEMICTVYEAAVDYLQVSHLHDLEKHQSPALWVRSGQMELAL